MYKKNVGRHHFGNHKGHVSVKIATWRIFALGGGEVTFKVAYLTTEYDPTLMYGVKTTIETLTSTRLSCIHTSYPKCSHLVWRQSISLCVVMTMTMYEPCLSVSQLSRLDVDTTQQLANRNDSYVSPGAVMMVSSGLAAAARVSSPPREECSP